MAKNPAQSFYKRDVEVRFPHVSSGTVFLRRIAAVDRMFEDGTYFLATLDVPIKGLPGVEGEVASILIEGAGSSTLCSGKAQHAYLRRPGGDVELLATISLMR